MLLESIPGQDAAALATYGVYGAVVFCGAQFTAYGVRFAKAGDKGTRTHYARMEWGWFIATVFFLVLSVATWLATRHTVIIGSIAGVIDESDVVLDKGKSRIVDVVVPEDHDPPLYRLCKEGLATECTLDAVDPVRPRIRALAWAIVSEPTRATIRVQFTRIRQWTDFTQNVTPDNTPSPPVPRDSMELNGVFALHLDVGQRLVGARIQLRYDSATTPGTLGTIYQIGSDSPVIVPWATPNTPDRAVAERRDRSNSWLALVQPAWAQGVATARPDSTLATDSVLRDLYRKDPQRRNAAIHAIGQIGPKGCEFVREQLSDKAPFEQEHRKDVLDALAAARDSVQEKANCASADLLLALRYYDLRDFGKASTYFERVPERELTQPLWLYYRGVAYAQTQTRDSAAAESLRDFERRAPSDVARAAAWTYLGAIHDHSGSRSTAITDYERALQLARQPGPVRWQALNNLAYIYAQQGERLDVALDLINQALASDTTTARLDTKAWVLFQLGRCVQADSLSQVLAKQYPNPVYRAHADSIRNSLGNRKKCH